MDQRRRLHLMFRDDSGDAVLALSDEAGNDAVGVALDTTDLRRLIDGLAAALRRLEEQELSRGSDDDAPIPAPLSQPRWRLLQQPSRTDPIMAVELWPGLYSSFTLSAEDAGKLGQLLTRIAAGQGAQTRH